MLSEVLTKHEFKSLVSIMFTLHGEWFKIIFGQNFIIHAAATEHINSSKNAKLKNKIF